MPAKLHKNQLGRYASSTSNCLDCLCCWQLLFPFQNSILGCTSGHAAATCMSAACVNQALGRRNWSLSGVIFWPYKLQHTNSPNLPPYISLKKLLREFYKRSCIFTFVIIFSILIIISLDNVWISLGENWCWSPLGLKGLKGLCHACLYCIGFFLPVMHLYLLRNLSQPKRTGRRQKCIFVSKKYLFRALYRTLQTARMKFEELLG